jgi:hypothetical protein
MLLEILNWSPKKRIIKPKGPEWYIHYPRADGPTKGGARVAAYILLLPHGPWRLGVPLHQNPSSHRAASAPPVLDSTGWKSATTTSPSTPWTASRYTFFPNTSAPVFSGKQKSRLRSFRPRPAGSGAPSPAHQPLGLRHPRSVHAHPLLQ